MVVCFAAKTLIRTPYGDIPVERLKIGDAVETHSGERRPIKWLGHRVCGGDEDGKTLKHEVVRIAAHAFGPNRPAEDLVVSPGHAVCVDVCGEVLIPAGYLVNGATIVRELRESVTFWHVELDSHDILVANNLPAESYLAMGNRGYFEEAGASLESFEEGVDLTHADFCRPVAVDGEIVAFVRSRLLARASALGWTPSHDDGLSLQVDGESRGPAIEEDAAAFLFPAGAGEVALVSDTFVPLELGFADDRVLGVMLTGLVFSDRNGRSRRIAIDDARLRDGVHDVEADAQPFRWTNGALVLDPELWAGLASPVSLLVSCDRSAVRGWIAPPAPANVPLEVRPRLHAVR